MRMPQFVKEVIRSVTPKQYRSFTQESFRRQLGFMSIILLIAVLIAGVFYAPKLLTLKSTITEELTKFDTFTITGNASTSEAITIPRTDPFVVIDTETDRTLGEETFLVTKEEIQYRWFGKRSVEISKLKEPKTYRAQISGFLTILFLMLLPSFGLFLYISAWIKYLILSVLIGSILFIILELTSYKLRWKQITNIVLRVSFIPILVEVISAPINTTFLFALPLKFLGLHLYGVTLLAWIILSIIGIVFAHTIKK